MKESDKVPPAWSCPKCHHSSHVSNGCRGQIWERHKNRPCPCPLNSVNLFRSITFRSVFGTGVARVEGAESKGGGDGSKKS